MPKYRQAGTGAAGAWRTTLISCLSIRHAGSGCSCCFWLPWRLLAYAPSLNIPLIADDYPNISQALTYGAPGGLGTLLHDAQFRLRATSYWAMYALWQVAGLNPAVYHAASLLLHIANTWLLFFVASAWPRMRPAAFWAAAFFAVHEGHQEAVMWFSAINELLMFFFGMASLWCWRSAPDGVRQAWWKELAGVVLFALALLSKESAIFLLPLFVLAVEPAQWRARLPRLAPHVVLVLLAWPRSRRAAPTRSASPMAASHCTRRSGSPGRTALARLLWIWGWPAAIVVLVASAMRDFGAAPAGAGVDRNRAGAVQLPDLLDADSEPADLSRERGTGAAGGPGAGAVRGTAIRDRGVRGNVSAQHAVSVDQEACAVRGARGAHRRS